MVVIGAIGVIALFVVIVGIAAIAVIGSIVSPRVPIPLAQASPIRSQSCKSMASTS